MSDNTTSSPIKLLLVVSIPTGRESIQKHLNALSEHQSTEGRSIEIVAVAYNKRSAYQELKSYEPDLVILDLMLPNMRSIEIAAYISTLNPEIKIIAMSPEDTPHEELMLCLQAGVLGYFTEEAKTEHVLRAIDRVLCGKKSLPEEATYDVLQQAASDLVISRKEKRTQFLSALIGLVPLAGILAAFISFLWREYWGQIGVRVGDLGVDSSKRVVELFISILLLVGMIGPLLYINSWLDAIEERFGKLKKWIYASRAKPGLKRALYARKTQWIVFACMLLMISMPLNFTGGKILTIVIGVIFAAALLANMAGFAQALPTVFHLSKSSTRWVYTILGGIFTLLILALSVEVFLRGPDLRHDGVHGFVVKKALDVSARPAMFYDLDGKHPPLGALYLGGNADLYVLYDPNTESVRMIPVGSTRVEIIDEVPVLDDGKD
ncbi:response regulator [Rubritalea marina]|uniref:response regulator n=1 Tax=Rubritalea marina TaxID=361055 RepID=UPI0003784230|nr:response regulator [Rubritalea marina]